MQAILGVMATLAHGYKYGTFTIRISNRVREIARNTAYRFPKLSKPFLIRKKLSLLIPSTATKKRGDTSALDGFPRK